MKKRIFSTILIIAVIFISAICAFAQENTAKLWITHNFSSCKLLEKKVEIDNSSVMSILKNNAQIKTAYAGGFVAEINGLASGEESGMRSDWFYYVNGIMANIGALAYFPQANDVIWWDYHSWDNTVYISSVIGCYPQPFLNGYNGEVSKTVILHTKTFSEEVNQLKASLFQKGVKEVKLEEYQGDIPQENLFFILIGLWNELKDDKRIIGIVENYTKTGFFVKFKDSQLQALDIKGNIAREFNDAAVILSIKAGFQSTNPLWIITGTNNIEIRDAIKFLTRESEKIKFHSAAIISKGKVFNVPFAKNE